MKIIPLHNQVLLELEVVKEDKAGAILLAEKEVETGIATVLAIGPEVARPKEGSKKEDSYPYISVGNQVFTHGVAGKEIKLDGKRLFLVTDRDIFAIIEQ